ncbi:MAG: helix-turn-helix domain-containing protein [Ruminococcaceae bacterium]|nr:helix-turn-helix domain-containing protein [Oscillospiraceae bacterium]
MRTYQSKELMTEDASLHIFSVTNEARTMPLHEHDFIEIVYVTNGSADETVNGETWRVHRGDLLFINYQSTHSFVSYDNFSYINICFKPEMLGEAVITSENAFALLHLTAFEEILRESGEDGMVSWRGDERREIETVLFAMLREYCEKPHSWRLVLKSYMNVLIAMILRKLIDGGTGEDSEDVWRELSEYIDSNLGEELTLSALAGKCFYNPSYFSRAFKKKFKMPLTEYLNRRRIERAMLLCEDPSLSDEEIATRLGFSYKSSFYRVFSRVAGMTFAEYKKSKK